MFKGKHPSAAFSLVEVIVAMSIFVMVIAGGFAGVHRGLDMVGNSRHYTRVSQILQSEVEALRTLSWSELQTLPASADIQVTTQFNHAAYAGYAVHREIISEQADLKRVEVSVSFTNKNGREITLKYLTFFTEGGVNDYYYRTI